MNFSNKKYLISTKFAFTLAEVLITLGIIGVVAALTIPTLISNKKKTEYVTQVKKAYTTLEQTVRLAEVENGPFDNWEYAPSGYDFAGADAVKFANTYLIPYMNVVKNCGMETGCWAPQIKRFKGVNFTSYVDNSNFAKFILADGTAIHVGTMNSANLALIHFDINGLKGPNIYGHDILTYWIYPKRKLGIAWYNGSTRTYLTTTSPNACEKTSPQPDCCLPLLIHDGWQIKDDYPWP